MFYQLCAFWSRWGEFGPCSASCSGGFTSRIRSCIGGEAGINPGCLGDSEEVDLCNTQVSLICIDGNKLKRNCFAVILF